MVRTEVGYIGGSTPHPTYHAIADHAEGVDVRFDPEVVTYEDLLDEFWASHEPTSAARSTQYRAAIYAHDAEQRARAEASRERCQAEIGRPVHTEIFTGQVFHAAEDYHQKWRLRRSTDLWAELQTSFPDEAALLASATAAKLNGLVGPTDPVALARYIDRLGLSAKGRRILANGGR